jgi:Ribose/Galactose Isomerase
MLKIGIGADHAGFAYKQQIIEMLSAQGYTVQDFGTNSEQSVDYPDYVHPLATAIEDQKLDMGIVVCGSGNGVAITVGLLNLPPLLANTTTPMCWLSLPVLFPSKWLKKWLLPFWLPSSKEADMPIV